MMRISSYLFHRFFLYHLYTSTFRVSIRYAFRESIQSFLMIHWTMYFQLKYQTMMYQMKRLNRFLLTNPIAFFRNLNLPEIIYDFFERI